MECDFCLEECDGKLVLRDINISKKDGNDIVLCPTCMNLYANADFDELERRLKNRGGMK